MERDQVIQIGRLMLIDLKSVKNGSDVSEFRGLDKSTSTRILNLLKLMYL